MRFLSWLPVIALCCAACWFKRQQHLTEKQLAALNDSLTSFHLNYRADTAQQPISRLDTLIWPKLLQLGDSLNEIHRIIWRTQTEYGFTITERKDSSVWLEYKHYGFKNPLTGKGNSKLIAAKTIAVARPIFLQFRQKLAAVPFFDASKSEEWLGCQTTGALNWEARFQKEGHLKHATSCRQSAQFAEACEMMMRLVDDPQLQQAVDAAISAK